MENYKHISVLKNECLEALKIENGGIYFDGTLGGAGHSEEILKQSTPDGKLFATDLDTDAIGAAEKKLNKYSGRYTLIHDNFKNFNEIVKKYEIKDLNGILLDLGVSSYQIDSKERGFSYMAQEHKLDMRMDKTSNFCAIDILNSYSEKELTRILRQYSEEKFAHLIARKIVSEREKYKIETVSQLNAIIDLAIPNRFKTKGHSAKKTYQALRIEVNSELANLYETVVDMVSKLKVGGRMAVISFHSLEDRIIKQAFSYLAADCVCSKDLPICICGKKSLIKIINKKPIEPSFDEIKLNSRSKSAKLRIAERV